MATLTTIPADHRWAERNLGTYGRDHRARTRGDPNGRLLVVGFCGGATAGPEHRDEEKSRRRTPRN